MGRERQRDGDTDRALRLKSDARIDVSGWWDNECNMTGFDWDQYRITLVKKRELLLPSEELVERYEQTP